YQTSSKNLSQLLASQTNDKTGLGYDNQVFHNFVFDSDELFSSESNVREGYHALPPPYTGTFMPPKPDLVFHDTPTINETVDTAFNVELSPTKPDKRGNHQHYARMTHPNPQSHVVPTAVLTRSKLVPLTAARPVTTAVPQPHVTRPRPAKNVVTKSPSPPRRTVNLRSSPTHTSQSYYC
nr:hypothetical protein [Tanacetum cinerariifolium]